MDLRDTAGRFLKSLLSPWGLFALVACAGCVPTYTGFLGTAWWRFDLTSHFRVQYFVVLTAGTIVFAVGRKWKMAIVPGISAVLNLALILPLYSGPSVPENRGRPFRAVMMNVHRSNTQHDKVLTFIRSSDPDVVLLLEVNDIWMKALQAIQADYPYSRCVPRSDNFGIVLLSRVQFVAAEVPYFGSAGKPTIVARFDIEGRPLTIVGTHPVPPVSRRCSHYRNEQLEQVAAFVREQEGSVIVLADVNMTSWSPHFRTFLRRSGLRDSRKGFGVQPTWPSYNPILRIPIDHCLVSDGVVIHDRRVGSDVGSDHYPIVITFSVGAP